MNFCGSFYKVLFKKFHKNTAGALFSIFLQAKSFHRKLLGLKLTLMDIDYLQNFAKVTAPLAAQIRLTQSKQLKPLPSSKPAHCHLTQ